MEIVELSCQPIQMHWYKAEEQNPLPHLNVKLDSEQLLLKAVSSSQEGKTTNKIRAYSFKLWKFSLFHKVVLCWLFLMHLSHHACPAGLLKGNHKVPAMPLGLRCCFCSVYLPFNYIFLSATKSQGAILGCDQAKKRAKHTE